MTCSASFQNVCDDEMTLTISGIIFQRFLSLTETIFFLCSDDEVDEKCAIIFNTCKEMYKKKATGISANETIVDENESRSKELSHGLCEGRKKHHTTKRNKHIAIPASMQMWKNIYPNVNSLVEHEKQAARRSKSLIHLVYHIFQKKLKSLNYNEDSIAVSPNYLRDLIPTDGEYSKKPKSDSPDVDSDKIKSSHHSRKHKTKSYRSKRSDADSDDEYYKTRPSSSRSHYSAKSDSPDVDSDKIKSSHHSRKHKTKSYPKSDSPDVDSDKIKSSHHSRKHKTKSYRSKRSDADSDDEYYKTRPSSSRSHYSAKSDSPDVDSDKIKSSHHSRKHKTKSYRSKRSNADSDDEYYKTRSSYSKKI
ncbi:hypothetical protein CEXT_708891 [Caerostris extrusa]|uniref:Uncharacterized protein n=1 Tax=Caerostris extrusa TaxID=172846 RepID=A0AAV4VMR0_CAEEX|nr:hypothetical protein CEXT_708891 [Caerostris extrusa]